MFSLDPAALAALDGLGALRPGPAQQNATRAAKAARRAIRHAAFDASIREGLRFSRNSVRRRMKHKGDGGARLEFQMQRIIP